MLQLKKNPPYKQHLQRPPCPCPRDTTLLPPSSSQGKLLSRAGSRNPKPFGDSASFQPHRLPFPGAFCFPAGKHLSFLWGGPPGKQEFGITRLFLEFSPELFESLPFQAAALAHPQLPQGGRTLPRSLFPRLSCKLTLLESTTATAEVQSSPISSTPKNKNPAVVLAPSHPRAPVLAAAGHTRAWGIAGSGWDGVSWEPELLPKSQPCWIDHREGLKFGESSLATVTVCAGC